jgi:hypothetical protein
MEPILILVLVRQPARMADFSVISHSDLTAYVAAYEELSRFCIGALDHL